jgi:hypothetical protein
VIGASLARIRRDARHLRVRFAHLQGLPFNRRGAARAAA